jgi:uncharacterized protein (TIGR01741 family)
MEKLYTEIAGSLNMMIPEEWSKILLYAGVDEGYSQVYFYYYPKTNNKPIYSLDIVDRYNIDKKIYESFDQKLYDCFVRLWEEFKIQGQEPWTYLTFILDNEGKMKIDFKYDDISALDFIERQNKWEAEHLGFVNK